MTQVAVCKRENDNRQRMCRVNLSINNVIFGKITIYGNIVMMGKVSWET